MKKLLDLIENKDFNFISNYTPIITQILRSNNIVLSDNQKRYLKHLKDNRFSICLKPRQVGESSLTAMYILDSFISENRDILIYSNNKEQSMHILEKIRYYMGLCGIEEDKGINSEIRLNGHIIKAGTGDVRGWTFDTIYFDEAASLLYGENIFHAAMMSLRMSNSRMIISSTPRGDNWFKELYENAVLNNVQFKAFNFLITDNPLMDDKKILDMSRGFNFDVRLIRQEIEGQFV